MRRIVSDLASELGSGGGGEGSSKRVEFFLKTPCRILLSVSIVPFRTEDALTSDCATDTVLFDYRLISCSKHLAWRSRMRVLTFPRVPTERWPLDAGVAPLSVTLLPATTVCARVSSTLAVSRRGGSRRRCGRRMSSSAVCCIWLSIATGGSATACMAFCFCYHPPCGAGTRICC